MNKITHRQFRTLDLLQDSTFTPEQRAKHRQTLLDNLNRNADHYSNKAQEIQSELNKRQKEKAL